MPRILFRAADGGEVEVLARVGVSLMEVAVLAGVSGIGSQCGGVMRCATCHVRLPRAWQFRLDPPCDDERMMLELVVERRAGSRLSCQVMVTDQLDGLVVELDGTAG